MIKKLLLFFFLLFFIYIASAFLNPFPSRKTPVGSSPAYGVTFSQGRMEWFGLDWKKSYVELLDKNKFSWVRLPFSWDQMTDDDGKLKLGGLKFLIEEAGKRNIQVVIALGAKTPYYPEYHLPKNLKNQLKFGQTISPSDAVGKTTIEVDKAVVSELSGYKNIAYWQVENEPLLPNVNGWKIGIDQLRAEVDAVRQTDPQKRPIILSHVGPAAFDGRWKKLLSLLNKGDVLGVNAYFETEGMNLSYFKVFGRIVTIPWPKWFAWPVQSWLFLSPNFEAVRKAVESHGNQLWVLEAQAEPYIRGLEDARKKDFSLEPRDIKKVDQFLRSQSIKSIGLWDSGFWLYRQSIGDNSWMQNVENVTFGN